MTLNAQNYKSSIGVRLGAPISASFKMFISDANAVEAFVNYRSYKNNIYGQNYGWSRIGAGVAYQMHKEIDAIDGLMYYYGGGVSVLYYNYNNAAYFSDYDNLSFGIQGNVGLDYAFSNVPVNLSLDWVPTLYINGYISGFGAGYGALSVRYILGE